MKQKKRACATCISHQRWFTERCTTLRGDVRRTAERNNKAKQPVTLNGWGCGRFLGDRTEGFSYVQ
ncbi:hypothetical protein, partial [Bifidobacterium longum]|uniref:hypothetical protein n=1 Tax=Bifidobacterium longum TaxID=216816 RepID=UPI001C70115E